MFRFAIGLTSLGFLCAAAAAQAAPSVEQVLAANQRAANASPSNQTGTLVLDFAYAGQGLTGTIHSRTDLASGWFVDEFAIGPTTGASGFDGRHAWEKDVSGTVTLQEGGDATALAINEAYRRSNLWWHPDRGSAAITLIGQKKDASILCDVLDVTPRSGKHFEAWFDDRSHQLVRIVEKQGPQTVTTFLSDFRDEKGLVLPHKQIVDDGHGEKFRQTLTIAKVNRSAPLAQSAFSAPKIAITDFAIAKGARETSVPFKLVNNHIYGSVKVDGKGPYTFIFDTGGHNVVTPTLAKSLGLKVEGSLPGAGAGEGVMEGGLTKVGKLEISDASVANQTFFVLPLDALSNVEGVPMPGMVGFEVFRRFVTRIDYGNGILTLIDPKTFDPKDAGIAVRFTFNGQIPEVMGTFEGLPAKFDIDTGSRSELTLTKPFATANNLKARHPEGVDAVEGWGVGGASRGYVTRGAFVTIGDLRIDNVVTSLSIQNKGAFSGEDYQGNVGGGILKRFVVTFDYEHQIMYLKPLPHSVGDIGTFDRSGMWINQVGDGFQIVDITPKGPAEKAGLKVNDVIVAIDGKKANVMPLYALRQRLRNDPEGTKVTFTVQRMGGKRDIAIMLKNQI